MVGQKKSGGQHKKARAWWNKETRQATKLKKQLYKKWLKDPTPQNKEQYQSARDACKQAMSILATRQAVIVTGIRKL